MVLLVAMALALATVAQAAFESYSFKVTDMSPMFAYSPSSSGTADQTWNQTWSQTNWSQWMTGQDMMGQGFSSHTTTFAGATVSISFLGTGVTFTGDASGSVSVIVDGGSDSPSDVSAVNTTVGQATGLDYAYHTVTLKLHSGELALQSAQIATYIGGSGARAVKQSMASLTEHTDQLWYMSDNITANDKNAWTASTSMCGYLAQDNSYCYGAYDRVGTSSPSAWMSFDIPANTAIALLYGTVGYGYGDYSITVQPTPYNSPSNVTLNGHSPWLGLNSVTFFAALDPTVQYKLIIDYLGNSTQQFDFVLAQFISPDGGDGSALPSGTTSDTASNAGTTATGSSASSSTGSGSSAKTGAGQTSSTPIGAIVGGVVGGVVVLAAVGVLIWWCMRRRSRSKEPTGKKRTIGIPLNPDRPRSALSDFVVDEIDMVHAPFTGGNDSVNSLTGPRMEGNNSQIDPYSVPPTKAQLAGVDPFYSPPQAAPGRFGGHTHSDSTYSGNTFGGPREVNTPSSPQSQSMTGFASSQDHPLSANARSPISPTSGFKATMSPLSRPAPQDLSVITQESDAGRVEATPYTAPTEERVPPRYDPSWASDLEQAGPGSRF